MRSGIDAGKDCRCWKGKESRPLVMHLRDDGQPLLGKTHQPRQDTFETMQEDRMHIKWWRYFQGMEGGRLLRVLSCLGASNAAEAVEVLCAGYILGGLSGNWRSLISSGVYTGMLLGGLVSGYMADRSQQRSKSLQISLLVAFAGSALAAFSPNPETLLACRVTAGAGVGAATPPLFALAAEVSPTPIRGACITYVASWWMLGSIFAAAFAKLVLVSTKRLDVNFDEPWVLSPWRCYALICSAPAMLSCLACYLNVQDGRLWSTLVAEESAIVANPIAGIQQQQQRENALEPHSEEHRPNRLRLRCNRKKVLTLGTTYWGLNFGYYGMATWISVVLAKVGVRDVYGITLLYAAANVPGNVAAFALVDSVGRKPLLAASMGLAALAAISLAAELQTNPTLVFTVSAAVIFNAASTAGWASLDALSAESFSARERATALGFLTAIGRVASIIAQFVNAQLIAHPPQLLAVTAAFMLFGTLATLGLKEPKHVDID